MCLPDFIEFKSIRKADAVIGYRNWVLDIKDENALLKSTNQNFEWKKQITKADKVAENNSGLYSYNNNNNNNIYYNYNKYYYYNKYNNYNNYNNNYNNNYYNIGGVIHQYGKVAIHSIGYRSQYALIDRLFIIRKSDAQGPKEFLDWIDKFNNHIEKLAAHYKCKVVSWQDHYEANASGRV